MMAGQHGREVVRLDGFQHDAVVFCLGVTCAVEALWCGAQQLSGRNLSNRRDQLILRHDGGVEISKACVVLRDVVSFLVDHHHAVIVAHAREVQHPGDGLGKVREEPRAIRLVHDQALGHCQLRGLVGRALGGIHALVDQLRQRLAAVLIGRLDHIWHRVRDEHAQVRTVVTLGANNVELWLIEAQARRIVQRGIGKLRHTPDGIYLADAEIGARCHAVDVERLDVIVWVGGSHAENRHADAVHPAHVDKFPHGAVDVVLLVLLGELGKDFIGLRRVIRQAHVIAHAHSITRGHVASLVHQPMLRHECGDLPRNEALGCVPIELSVWNTAARNALLEVRHQAGA